MRVLAATLTLDAETDFRRGLETNLLALDVFQAPATSYGAHTLARSRFTAHREAEPFI